MTAAIYAKRKGLTVAVIADPVGGQMGTTGDIENYPGFDVIRGSDLSRKMREQMQRLGVEPVLDRVSGVEQTGSGYRIVTQGGRSFEARSVIVASGAHWRQIGVPGEKEYISKGVSYCTTCDAPLFAGMDVAVVGGGNAAAEAVMELAGVASHIYMIVRSRLKCDEMTTVKIRKNNKVTVLEGYAVVRITGKDFVESMTVRSPGWQRRDFESGRRIRGDRAGPQLRLRQRPGEDQRPGRDRSGRQLPDQVQRHLRLRRRDQRAPETGHRGRLAKAPKRPWPYSRYLSGLKEKEAPSCYA